jgi:hypothetical protein
MSFVVLYLELLSFYKETLLFVFTAYYSFSGMVLSRQENRKTLEHPLTRNVV